MTIPKKPQRGETFIVNIIFKIIFIYAKQFISLQKRTENQKPMNRLEGILFIPFPTNKIRGLLLCLLIAFLQMITIYFNIKLTPMCMDVI